MGSFIIPSGILGLASPRTIYMDNGIQITNTRMKRRVKFGEGYKYTAPTSQPKRKVEVTFNAREPEEVNLIEDYFIYLGGANIDDLSIFNQSLSGYVTSFNKSYMNGAIYGLTATIEEK